MTRDNFLSVFFAHLTATLVAGLLLLPIGDSFFEVTRPSLGTYFFLGVYGMVGFPILDLTLLPIRKGVELGDTLGYFWLLLVPVNSIAAAFILLRVRQVWQR